MYPTRASSKLREFISFEIHIYCIIVSFVGPDPKMESLNVVLFLGSCGSSQHTNA